MNAPLRLLFLTLTTLLLASPGHAAALKWGHAILDKPWAWYSSDEARIAARQVLCYQSPEGAWPKNTDLLAPATDQVLKLIHEDGRGNTIDNQATTVPIRFLAAVASATKDEALSNSVLRGIDYLLRSQYANGGFPQFFPLREGYYSHVTYNDDAMVLALELLRDVSDGRRPFAFIDTVRRNRAAAAVRSGIACILRTQLKQDGQLTAWCAQYDEKTLEPAWARKYEPPSLSGEESVGIVRFLMSLDEPSPEIIDAVNGAVDWFRRVAITGKRIEVVPREGGRPDRLLVADPSAPPLWARFYELGTNRPLYMDRRSIPLADYSQVDYERRSGYNYHGYWPAELLEKDYPAWLARVKPMAAKHITTPVKN